MAVRRRDVTPSGWVVHPRSPPMRTPVKNSRIRSGLAAAVAVATIGVVSFSLTGADSAAGNAPAKPSTPVGNGEPSVVMTVHPPGGAAEFSLPMTSFQFGAGLGVGSPRGGDRSVSEPSISEIVVTREADATSPVLFGYLTKAVILPEVDLVGTLADGTTVDYELTDVILTGVSTSSGGKGFSESVTLNFTRITMGAGGNSWTYDLAANTTS